MKTAKRQRSKRPALAPIRPGRLVGIAREGAEWRAVYCRMPAFDPSEPYVFELRHLENLKANARVRAEEWVSSADGVASLPADLAKLQQRYAGRAISQSGIAARDARTILTLLAKLASASASDQSEVSADTANEATE